LAKHVGLTILKKLLQFVAVDSNDFHLVDTVLLAGTLTPEQKAHHLSIVLSIQTSIQEFFLPHLVL
jgi:hypothetical protein